MKQLGSIVLLTLGIFIGFIIAKVSQPLSINDMDNSNEPQASKVANDKAAMPVTVNNNNQEQLIEITTHDDESKAELIKALTERISYLEEKIALVDGQSSDGNSAISDSSNAELTPQQIAELVAQHKQEKALTADEVADYLEPPFDVFVIGKSGTIANDYRAFIKEPRETDWAYTMEQQISDFMLMHELSQQIKLDGVVCRQHSCEIRVFELQDNIVNTMLNDMRKQPWWNFRGTHASSQSNDGNTLFYILINKA